jgi:hypothetical protein
MPSNTETPDWRTLAELASKELDGNKLSALVDQLCKALDVEALGKMVRPIVISEALDHVTFHAPCCS